ncbi:MAG: DNA polymerase III subunit beta [Actinomycetota bacterium]
MKLHCDREKLLEAMQTCQRAISGKSMLPILSGILFKTENNSLVLSATDLEISIRTEVEVEAKEQGNMVIPARLVMDILNSLENEKVEFVSTGETGPMEIMAGDSKFSLSIQQEEDFPKIPEAGEKPSCEIAGAEFTRATREVVKAASRDESKPVLTGVLVEITKDMLKMVATDSYRLAVYETKISDGPTDTINIIVPARSLRELNRILSAAESKRVSVSLTENQVIFKAGSVEMISRLIDGEFPNHKQIIPEGYEKIIKMDKNKALGSIKRVAILAQNNAPIKMTATNNTIVVSASTQDVGEAIERFEAEYSGEEVKIAFNPDYLLDGISSVEEDAFALEITDPLKPAMIKPVEDKTFQYLIMPVRLT